MRKAAGTFTEDDCKRATSKARKQLDAARASVLDEQRERRIAECLCRACFYLRPERVVLQAFHTRPCAQCGEDVTYANSDTGLLCLRCARAEKACHQCGAYAEVCALS